MRTGRQSVPPDAAVVGVVKRAGEVILEESVAELVDDTGLARRR